MHQGKYHGAQGGDPSPAVGCEQLLKLGQAAKLRDGALGQVGHENEGKNNLIGRKPEKEGCQDNAIHPQGPAQRIEKAGEVGKEAHTTEFYIGHKPNDKACGRCDGRGPAQDKHSPIQYGAKKHTPHLRAPVWGKLQGEGGGHPF